MGHLHTYVFLWAYLQGFDHPRTSTRGSDELMTTALPDAAVVELFGMLFP